MEALQYIYTSWKNGNSTEKGYMIYSRSTGISDQECTAIKDAMQYLAPKGLNLTPTAQEIADVFPYSFAYFLLPTGRGCVAQSTYLGKDYSGRFGNYIIYALVFDLADLPCRPSELFAEPYIKTAMTPQELDAPSPVPPLPPVYINQYGSVINDEQLTEFLFDKEEEFAQLIALVLAARDRGVPFYLNDTRENLVLWSAALQRALPPRLAKRLTFNTYVGDQEPLRSPRIREEGLDFCLIGVRPDANYFSYATEYRTSRQVVMDFIGGYMTEGVVPGSFCQAMASSLSMDCEEADRFGAFLDGTSLDEINGRLQDAYLFYGLVTNGEFEFSEPNLQAVLRFGGRYCQDADNTDSGGKLLAMFQENDWMLTPEVFVEFWEFICRHTSFMLYTLYDLLQETLFYHAGDAAAPCAALDAMLDQLQTATPQYYQEFLDYLNSADCIEQLLLYLEGHENLHTNLFYLQWLLRSYPLPYGLDARQPVAKLLKALLANLCRIPGSERGMIQALLGSVSNRTLFAAVLQELLFKLLDPARLETLCSEYLEALSDLSEEQASQFDRLLLETPSAAPLAVTLCARKISAAKSPEDAFWHFYDQQKPVINRMENFSIEPMVLACLEHLDGSAKEKAAVQMVVDLDLRLLHGGAAVDALVDTINGSSMKALLKLEPAVLQKACRLRPSPDQSGLEKVRAVTVGEMVEQMGKEIRRSHTLADVVDRLPFSLSPLDKAEYETYAKHYLTAFMAQLQGSDDVALMMELFYHKRCFPDFVDDYIAAMKKLEKKDGRRRRLLTAWTCAYLAAPEQDDPAADELYQPMLQCLGGFDEEDLADIRQRVRKEVPGRQCDRLFDEVRRKDGLLGGLFRRK